MLAVIDDFNRSQDRIEVHYLPVSQVNIKLMLATSGGNPPDVAGLYDSNIPDFAEKGALLPLDGAMAKAGLGPEHYVPIFWKLCRYRGFTWSLPILPASTALFYNKAMFRAAGLDPERPPRTMAELDAMSRQLTMVEVERNGRREQVRFNQLTPDERTHHRFMLVQTGHLPEEPGWYLDLWGYWFGGRLYDGDRRILATDPGNLAAFEWFRQTAETFGVDNLRQFGSTFGTFASPQNAFLSGKVAMVLQGLWMVNYIQKYAPDLEWGVAPFPAVAGVAHGAPVTLVLCDMIVIPRGSPHPRAAFEFIRYLQRQDVAEKLALGERKFTALRNVSPGFYAHHPNPRIKFFAELARSPGACTVPRLTIWSEYNNEMVVAADDALYLDQTPAAALDDVQVRMQRRLDRALRRWDLVRASREKEWRQLNAQW